MSRYYEGIQTPQQHRSAGSSQLSPSSSECSTPFFTPPQFSSCVVTENSVGLCSTTITPLHFSSLNNNHNDQREIEFQIENPFIQHNNHNYMNNNSNEYSRTGIKVDKKVTMTGRIITLIESDIQCNINEPTTHNGKTSNNNDTVEEDYTENTHDNSTSNTIYGVKRILPEDADMVIPPLKKKMTSETRLADNEHILGNTNMSTPYVVFEGMQDTCDMIYYNAPNGTLPNEMERNIRVGKAYLETASALLQGKPCTQAREFEPGCLQVQNHRVDTSTSYSGVVLVETQQKMKPLQTRYKAPLTSIANYQHGHDCSALLNIMDQHISEHMVRLKQVQIHLYQAHVHKSILSSVVPKTITTFEQLLDVPRNSLDLCNNTEEVLTKDILPHHPEQQYWNTVPIHLTKINMSYLCQLHKWREHPDTNLQLASVAVEALIIEHQRCQTNLHVGARMKRSMMSQLEEADWSMEMAALRHLQPHRKLKHQSILNTLQSQTSTGIDEKHMKRIQEARKHATAEFQIN